jgi:hypothetical protein
MSESNEDSSSVSRRSVLRKGAGASIGITSLSQTVAAWETADEGDINKLRKSEEVRAILKELGQGKLPKEGKTRTVSIGERGEMKTTKVDFEFGTLRFGELGEERNATFSFDDINHSSVPPKYADVPAGTDPILRATGKDVDLTREATPRERDAVLAAIPDEGDQSSVFTESEFAGFYVDVARNTSDPEKFEMERYQVQFEESNVNPALEGSREVLREGGELAASVEVESLGIKSKLIKEYVEGVLASNLGDELHECGSSCVGCVDWIISMALDCRLCGPVCTSASTGAGAVLCGICVYQFCNNVGQMVECADCIGCAVDGNSSWSDPLTPDIPEDIPGLPL